MTTPMLLTFMGRLNLGLRYKTHDHTYALGIKNDAWASPPAGRTLNSTGSFRFRVNSMDMFQLYRGYGGENLIESLENTKHARCGHWGGTRVSWF